MLNKIIIMGRLTRDPELRTTQSGTAVASFTLACERDFADKATGQRGCDFIDCVAWKGTAEFISSHFSKGRMAVVSGRLQIRDWTDRDGNKRKAAEIVAESVYFADSKRDEDGGKPAQTAQNGAQGQNYNTAGEFAELSEDDGALPF